MYKTGRGISKAKPLTPLEEKLVGLIGLDADDGLQVPENCSMPIFASIAVQEMEDRIFWKI